MRRFLILLFVLLSLHVASAQETSHAVITVENAQLLAPLYIINEEFSMASFSQFEHDGTAVLLVDSVYNESERRSESTIKTWDLASQAINNTITFASNGYIYNPMQIPENSTFATIGVGGTVVVQDYPSGTIRREFDSTSLIHSYAAISADSRRLVHTQCVWTNDARVDCYPQTWFFIIYDTDSLEVYNTVDIQLERLDILNGYTVRNIALSETGRYLLIEGTTELNIFDTTTLERVLLDESRCWECHASFISETDILTVRLPYDGATSEDIVEWNFQTGEVRSILPYPEGELRFMKLSLDRTILGVLTDSKLYLVNFRTGEILKEIEFETREFTFDFSPDGHYLLLGNTIYGVEN